ncbi:transcription initiation factor TFIID subunit, partial [Reticulomyxa filosa]
MYGQRIANSMNNQISKNVHRDTTDATEEEFANAKRQQSHDKESNAPVDNNNNNNQQNNAQKTENKNEAANANSDASNKLADSFAMTFFFFFFDCDFPHLVGTSDLEHQDTMQPTLQSNALPSFKKHSTLAKVASGENKPPSGLSKTVAKHAPENASEVAVLPSDGLKSKQIVDSRGKITLQELPFNQETH